MASMASRPHVVSLALLLLLLLSVACTLYAWSSKWASNLVLAACLVSMASAAPPPLGVSGLSGVTWYLHLFPDR